MRINAGGPAYTAANGNTFLADQYFTGGSTNSTTAAISGTTDQALYKDERWGAFSYRIPVVNGTYDVKLHFAEIYYGSVVPGSCVAKRVFSMDVGDTTANPDVPNLDVCLAAGGPNAAYVRTISNVQVSDGFLDLQSVYGSADDPELTAIEVVPTTGGPPGPPTVTDQSPGNGSTGVSTASAVTATFSRGIDASTITASSFTLSAGRRLRAGHRDVRPGAAPGNADPELAAARPRRRTQRTSPRPSRPRTERRSRARSAGASRPAPAPRR